MMTCWCKCLLLLSLTGVISARRENCATAIKIHGRRARESKECKKVSTRREINGVSVALISAEEEGITIMATAEDLVTADVFGPD